MMNEYIERDLKMGFSLVPLLPRDKRPHPKWAPDGLHNSTNDPAVIKEWPKNINIGVRTGEISGVIVLDLDTDKLTGEPLGETSLIKFLQSKGITKISTYAVRTGSGGYHLYFKITANYKKIGNRHDVLPGIDIKGENGYVVAPPSTHKNGHVYEIYQDLPIAPIPDWLYELYEMGKDDQANQTNDAKEYGARKAKPSPLSDEAKQDLADLFGELYDPSYGFGHDLCLAWNGSMAIRGVPMADAWGVVKQAIEKRKLTGITSYQLQYTYKHHEQGGSVVGLTTLKKIIGKHLDKYPQDILEKIDSVYNKVFPPSRSSPELSGPVLWEYTTDGLPGADHIESVVCTDKEVILMITYKDGEVTRVRGRVILHRPLLLERIWRLYGDEEDQYSFQFRLGKTTYIGTKEDVAKRISGRGLAGVNSEDVKKAVSACVAYNDLNEIVPVETRYGAIGIYEQDGQWVYATNDVVTEPRTEPWRFQQTFKPYAGILKEDLERFNKVTEFYANKGALAILFGLSALAPFSYVLKGHGDIYFPLTVMKGPKETGKSTLGRLFTKYLYGVDPGDSSDVTSEFRLLDKLSVSTFPSFIDEAEKAAFSEWLNGITSILKDVASSQIAGSRGNKDKTKKIYAARTLLILAGNRFKIEDQALLARTLLINFDGSNNVNTAKRKEFDELRHSMTIGFGTELSKYIMSKYTIDELYAKIKSATFNFIFADSRREDFYALIYVGLQLWSEFLQTQGIQFSLQDYLDMNKFMTLLKSMEEQNLQASAETNNILDLVDWDRSAMAQYEKIPDPTNDPWGRKIMANMMRITENGKDWVYMTRTAISMARKDISLKEKNAMEVAEALSELFRVPLEVFYTRKTIVLNKEYRVKAVKVPLDGIDLDAHLPPAPAVKDGKDDGDTGPPPQSAAPSGTSDSEAQPAQPPTESGDKLIRVRFVIDYSGDEGWHIPAMSKGDTFYLSEEAADDLIRYGVAEVVPPRIPWDSDDNTEVKK